MRSSRPNTAGRYPLLPSNAFLEAEIVRRRDLESRRAQTWNEHTNYFHDWNVKTERHSVWSSARSMATSMDSARREKQKQEHEEMLIKRREKLVKLYKEEKDAYEKELKEFEKLKEDERLRSLQHRVIFYRTKEVEALEKEAEKLKHEQWRRNTPAVREMKSRQLQEQVKSTWSAQLEEKKALKQREEEEDAEWARKLERDAKKFEEEQKQRDNLVKQKAKAVEEDLEKQIEQFKLREKEAHKAAKQYDKLLENRNILELLSKDQDKEAEERCKKDYGLFLIKQHLAKLRQCSRHVQEELELDMQMMKKLQECEEEEQQRQHHEFAQKKKNAQWMLDWIEKQQRIEQSREKDTDFMFQEEARRVWEKQEQIWKKEREAREALMREVIENQRQQIAEKLLSVEKERESLKGERECLLEQMNQQERAVQKEKEDEWKRKENLRLTLEDQMKKRHEEAEMHRQEEENYIRERQLRKEEEERRLAFELKNMDFHKFY